MGTNDKEGQASQLYSTPTKDGGEEEKKKRRHIFGAHFSCVYEVVVGVPPLCPIQICREHGWVSSQGRRSWNPPPIPLILSISTLAVVPPRDMTGRAKKKKEGKEAN